MISINYTKHDITLILRYTLILLLDLQYIGIAKQTDSFSEKVLSLTWCQHDLMSNIITQIHSIMVMGIVSHFFLTVQFLVYEIP